MVDLNLIFRAVIYTLNRVLSAHLCTDTDILFFYYLSMQLRLDIKMPFHILAGRSQI